MKKLLFAGALLLLAAGCTYESIQAPSSQPQRTTFSGSYQTGFEGHDTKFDYSISYPNGAFTASKATQGFTLKETANGHVHQVLFGFNGGLGATSSAEFWSAHQYCNSCKLSANVLNIAGAEDMKTYSNSTDEWTVYRAGDDFVVIDMKKPDTAAIDAFNTLGVRTTKIVTQ